MGVDGELARAIWRYPKQRHNAAVAVGISSPLGPRCTTSTTSTTSTTTTPTPAHCGCSQRTFLVLAAIVIVFWPSPSAADLLFLRRFLGHCLDSCSLLHRVLAYSGPYSQLGQIWSWPRDIIHNSLAATSLFECRRRHLIESVEGSKAWNIAERVCILCK